jgi:hypothetical protein
MSKRRQQLKATEYQRQRQQRTQAFGIGLVVLVGLSLLVFFILRARPGAFTPSPSTDTYLEWPIVVADAFNEQANGWGYGVLTDTIADVTLSLVGGRYHWEMAPRNVVLWPSLANPTYATSDLYVAVDARQLSGTPRSDYGLVFRLTGPDYYYYQVSPAAQQFAFNLQYDGQWIPLIDWTAAPTPIEIDNLNRLAVAAEGTRFTLYLNGEVAGTVTDDHLAQGSAGVGVQVYFDDPGGDNSGTYEFDNFEWRAPDGAP